MQEQEHICSTPRDRVPPAFDSVQQRQIEYQPQPDGISGSITFCQDATREENYLKDAIINVKNEMLQRLYPKFQLLSDDFVCNRDTFIHFANIKKHYFTNRVTPTRNSLPNSVVTTDSINSFKSRLDKLWSLHGIDYRAQPINYVSTIKSVCCQEQPCKR